MRRPVGECSADELHRELVADFVAGVHTPLDRFIDAVTRISRERRLRAERVYQDIRAEALALGGKTNRFG